MKVTAEKRATTIAKIQFVRPGELTSVEEGK